MAANFSGAGRTILQIWVLMLVFLCSRRCYAQVVGHRNSQTNTVCSLFLSTKTLQEGLEKLTTDSDIARLVLQHKVIFSSARDKHKALDTFWMLVKDRSAFRTQVFLRDFLLLPLWTVNEEMETVYFDVLTESSTCTFNDTSYNTELHSLLLKNLTITYDKKIFICSAKVASSEMDQVCCHVAASSESSCSNISPLRGGDYLKLFLFIVKLIVIFLIAGLIPKKLYETRNGFREYVHVLKSPLEIVVSKISDHKNLPPQSFRAENILGTTSSTNVKKNRYLHDDRIEKMSDYVKHMDDESKEETLKVHAVWIKVHQNRLLSEHSSPVRLLGFLYRRLLECKCYMQGLKSRKKKGTSTAETVSLHECCSQDCCLNHTWQTFGREFVRFVMFIVLSLLPWITFMFMGYTDVVYEKALPYHHFTFFSHFRSCNTLPLYTICCVFWMIPFVLYSWISLISNPIFKIRTISIFRRNIRIMRNPSGIGWSWSASFLLRPFAKKPASNTKALYYILALVCQGLCTVLAGLVLIFYNLPTLNLYVRLLYTFVRQFYLIIRNKKEEPDSEKSSSKRILKKTLNIPDPEKADDHGYRYELELNTLKDRAQWGVLCAIWVIFLVFAVFPFIDLVIIAVDLILNFIIGSFLGIRLTALYVLTALALLSYRHMFFATVERRFQIFNRRLHLYLKRHYTKKLLCTIATSEDGLLGNTAIQVIPTSGGCKKCVCNYTFSNMNGIPKLEAKYMIQFMDKSANVRIARSFFFEACYLNHFSCPGSASNLLYKATLNFIVTAAFIITIMCVLLMFGETLALDFTFQLIALLLGTLLPLIFYRCVCGKRTRSSLHRQPALDDDDEGFKFCLENLLREYSQKWTIIDFEVSRPPIVKKEVRETSGSSVCNRVSARSSKGSCWFSTPSREFVHVQMRDLNHGRRKLSDRHGSISPEEESDGSDQEKYSWKRGRSPSRSTSTHSGSQKSSTLEPLVAGVLAYADETDSEHEYDSREKHKHHPEQTGREIIDFMRTLTAEKKESQV